MLDNRRGLLIGSLAAVCALGLACGAAPEEMETPATEAAPARTRRVSCIISTKAPQLRAR